MNPAEQRIKTMLDSDLLTPHNAGIAESNVRVVSDILCGRKVSS